MIYILINTFLYFCWAIILAANPLSLFNLYKKLDNSYLNNNRIETTKYVWGFGNTLNDNYEKSEKIHLKDVKKLLIYIVNSVIFYSYFFYEYVNITINNFICVNLFLLFIYYNLKNNFHSFWNILHKPFFKKNTWLFPYNSLIIKSFPPILWYYLIIRILIIFYLIIFYMLF